MTKSSKAKLEYQKRYNARPDQTALGVDRRRERRQAISRGEVAIGDGKDLAHKKAADNGGATKKSNLKVESSSKNRDWRKGQKGYKVPDSK